MTHLLWLWLTILATVIDPNTATDYSIKPDNYKLAQPCCAGDNVYQRACRNASLLHCEQGRYLIDPMMMADEDFTITADGELVLQDDDHAIEKGEYCVTFYAPTANESRYVAFACFDEAESMSLFYLKGTLALISVFAIALTLYVYKLIRLRDTQDRVTVISLVCLLFFFLTLGITQLMPHNEYSALVCVPIGKDRTYIGND